MKITFTIIFEDLSIVSGSGSDLIDALDKIETIDTHEEKNFKHISIDCET